MFYFDCELLLASANSYICNVVFKSGVKISISKWRYLRCSGQLKVSFESHVTWIPPLSQSATSFVSPNMFFTYLEKRAKYLSIILSKENLIIIQNNIQSPLTLPNLACRPHPGQSPPSSRWSRCHPCAPRAEGEYSFPKYLMMDEICTNTNTNNGWSRCPPCAPRAEGESRPCLVLRKTSTSTTTTSFFC